MVERSRREITVFRANIYPGWVVRGPGATFDWTATLNWFRLKFLVHPFPHRPSFSLFSPSLSLLLSLSFSLSVPLSVSLISTLSSVLFHLWLSSISRSSSHFIHDFIPLCIFSLSLSLSLFLFISIALSIPSLPWLLPVLLLLLDSYCYCPSFTLSNLISQPSFCLRYRRKNAEQNSPRDGKKRTCWRFRFYLRSLRNSWSQIVIWIPSVGPLGASAICLISDSNATRNLVKYKILRMAWEEVNGLTDR